jgi:hypothetical protein
MFRIIAAVLRLNLLSMPGISFGEMIMTLIESSHCV